MNERKNEEKRTTNSFLFALINDVEKFNRTKRFFVKKIQ